MDINSKVSFTRNMYKVVASYSGGIVDVEAELTGFPIKKNSIDSQVNLENTYSPDVLERKRAGVPEMNGGSSTNRQNDTLNTKGESVDHSIEEWTWQIDGNGNKIHPPKSDVTIFK